MSRHRGNFMIVPLALLLAALCRPGDCPAQTAGLGLNPAKLEVEIHPGVEKTVGFRIESPPSDKPVRGRLMLSLTDWTVDGQANATYADPGTLANSASPWIIFSPAAISITSGDSCLVRVTVTVPESTPPGVYRSAIFVQERPPATPPNPGEYLLYFRFRYVFTLYVIVPPVAGRGELLDVRMESDREGVKLVYEIKNAGSRHVRPRVSWSVRDADQQEILSARNKETPVLLPFAAMTVRFPVAEYLLSGQYQLEAQVDFNDGGSVQAMKRTVNLPASSDERARASAIKR
jgi:P pilus assembly chaperone PapD